MRGSYVIGLDVIKKMKEDAIILHPLPRIDEISTDVDSSKQAKYFEQAEYGKYTRAALLGLILNENGFWAGHFEASLILPYTKKVSLG